MVWLRKKIGDIGFLSLSLSHSLISPVFFFAEYLPSHSLISLSQANFSSTVDCLTPPHASRRRSLAHQVAGLKLIEAVGLKLIEAAGMKLIETVGLKLIEAVGLKLIEARRSPHATDRLISCRRSLAHQAAGLKPMELADVLLVCDL